MRIAADRAASKRWVRERVRYWAGRLSVGPFPLRRWPRVVWSHAEAARLKTSLGKECRPAVDWTSVVCSAECDKPSGVVLFHLDRQRCPHHFLCRAFAEDTVVHEVMHLRFPAMPHSDLFYRRVEAAKRDRVRLGPKGARLPKGFPQ